MAGLGTPARLVAAGLAGALTVVALSPRPIGWFAWMALVPLFVALAAATARATLALTVLYTVTFSLLGLEPWFARSTAAYFGVPLGRMVALTIPPLALLATAHGLVLGAALLLRPRRAGPADVLFCAAVWTCWETLRTVTFPYFPAAVLGLTQHATIPVLQLASVTGVAGISFVVVACNVGVASMLSPARAGRRDAAALAGVALALGAAGWGALRLCTATDPAPGLRVVAVDIGATDPSASTLARYLDASRAAASTRPDLLIWPESALTTDLERDRSSWTTLSAFVGETGAPLLTGGAASAPRARGGIARYNAAHLLLPGHGMRSYLKRGLVPFAERWPPLAAAVFGDPPRDLASLEPGDDATVFALADSGFGVLICFEITSAAGARALAARGARFLVNLTNDAWFAGCGRPPHLPWAAVRAVETGLPVVRAANAGPSAVFDRFGRARAVSHGPALLSAGVPGAAPTLYARAGDVFLAACLVVVVGGALAAWRSR